MEKFCKNVIRVISLIIIVWLTFVCTSNVVTLNNAETSIFHEFSLFQILLFIVFIIVFFFVIRFVYLYFGDLSSKSKNKLFVFCLIFYALVSFFLLNYYRYTPYSDQLSVVRLATKYASQGLNGIKNSYYLNKYPHQVYMVYAFSLVFKIFRLSSYRVIQYLNVIANCFTFIGLRLLIKKIDMKHRGLFTIFYLSFIPLMLLLPFAYGDYIGLCLSVWALYFSFKYMDNKNLLNAFLIVFFLITSILFKSNNEIILVAVFIALTIDTFKFKFKEGIKNFGLILLIALFVLAPLKIIKNYFVNNLELEKQKSVPTVAYLYMAMSESSRANGWYDTTVIADAWNDNLDKEQVYKTNIKERLKYFKEHPGYTYRFYNTKMITGYADSTYACFFYIYVLNGNLDEVFSSNKIAFIYYYLKITNILIYVGAAYVLIFDFKKNSTKKTLIYLVFIGGFMFHLLWEMKSRYVLPYYVILMPIGTLGLSIMMEKMNFKKLFNKFKLKLK